MLQRQAPNRDKDKDTWCAATLCGAFLAVVAGAIDYRSLRLSHAPFCCQIKVISVAFMWPGRVPDNNCLPSFALPALPAQAAHPPIHLAHFRSPCWSLAAHLIFPHIRTWDLLLCVWVRERLCWCVSLCKFNKCRFVLRELGARACILVLPHTSRA